MSHRQWLGDVITAAVRDWSGANEVPTNAPRSALSSLTFPQRVDLYSHVVSRKPPRLNQYQRTLWKEQLGALRRELELDQAAPTPMLPGMDDEDHEP